ncbi:MAG TPA: lactate utilization protein C [Burkholderiales bacterium]|jgi:L-lactate dehydrogenase complex protein LldG|nr:lactate utilization protein C [Burkholderiales bacterium]
MSARENILTRIRARQAKGSATDSAAREAVRAHIAAHPQNPRPAVSWDPVARFRSEALKLASTVDEVESMAAVPACIAAYLDAQQLPREAVCWDALCLLDWRAAGIGIARRPARASDLIGITGSFCAIAETGTLMMLSGPQTPSAASLLPETHVAIVEKNRIVPGMEEAWQLMRIELGQAPRAVNFISGPSRTADIEQTVTLGAHGPYRVHIVLVGEGA